MPCIRIFEYDVLRTGEAYAPDGQRWEERHWQRLAAYKAQTQCPYFELLPQRVQFGQYVGLLQVDGLVIEILPKIDRTADTGSGVQSLLLQMLLLVLSPQTSLPLLELSTQAGRRRETGGQYLPSLLLLYWQLFAQALQKLLRTGLARGYRQVVRQRHSLRGRLLLPQSLQQQWAAKGHLLCTEASEYDEQQHCNRLLLTVLQRLGSLLRHSPQAESWARLCEAFAHCAPLAAVSEADFERYLSAAPSRATAAYLPALRLARLLIGLYEPTLSSGQWEGLSLMYDMNRLWEQYLSVSLSAAAPAQVRTQAGKAFWRQQEGGGAWQQLRPDIAYGHKPCLWLGDCKWKSQSSAADWRQLYVYAHYFGAQKAFLLLPAPASQTEAIKLQHIEFAPVAHAQTPTTEAAIAWIQCRDENGSLRRDIGAMLLQSL